MSRVLVRSGLLPILLLLAFLPALGAGPQDDVARVNGLLRRAESNIASVASNLKGRTSPPSGSAGKLLANRLQQVLGDLKPAKELLDTIPAGTEGREEAAARYSAAAEEYNRLNAIMTGSDAPAETPESSGGTPLGYQQKEVLSGARFNLREVEAGAEQLTTKLEEVRAIEDQLSIDHRVVNALREIVENAKRKSGFVKNALAKLPEDGEGVPEVRQRLVNADAKVVTAADYLNPLHARLQDIIDPANYPEFEADYSRLRELSYMFARASDTFQIDLSRAAESFAQAEPAKAECTRIAQKYWRLLQQRTDQGTSLEGVGNSFLRNHAEFLAEAESQKQALPEAIRRHMQTAKQYANDAVAAQKPLWFTGGIPQEMGYAEERVTLLTALDPEAGKRLKAEFDEAQAQIRKQADALRDLIIRENTMPPDQFQGDDREKAIKTALSAWKVQEKEFKVLKVRIPAEAWARETKWTYSNGTWYFSDRSKLQVRLLVADKDDKTLAIDRPINVWKDHQKGDSMIGVPLYGADDELQPHSYMLRSKIK